MKNKTTNSILFIDCHEKEQTLFLPLYFQSKKENDFDKIKFKY
jgi:hypothetical protein